MMDYRTLFNPVNQLYVPSGWMIHKNHLFNINKDAFDLINDKSERWMAKEYFITECVFLSQVKIVMPTNEILTGVVDSDCRIMDDVTFTLRYKIYMNISKKRKKKETEILSLSEVASTPFEAADIISNYMKSLSHDKIVNLETGQLL